MAVDESLNIENTDTIDALAYEGDTNKLILCIFDGMDWIDEAKHMLLLQSKLSEILSNVDVVVEHVTKESQA